MLFVNINSTLAKSFKSQLPEEFTSIGVEKDMVKKMANLAMKSIENQADPGVIQVARISKAEFQNQTDGSSTFNIELLVSILDSRRLIEIESFPLKVALEY